MELSILYFKGLLVKIVENYVFLSLRIVFIIANSADPDEMMRLFALKPYTKLRSHWGTAQSRLLIHFLVHFDSYFIIMISYEAVF